MKFFYLIICSIFTLSVNFGQERFLSHEQRTQHYEKKLDLLSFNCDVKERVKITSTGIHYVSHPNNARADFSIRWDQVTSFISFIKANNSPLHLRALYTNPTEVLTAYSPRNLIQEFPQDDILPLSGKRIAIDASKFARSMEEARLYDPFYVRLHRDSAGLNSDIELLESELNLHCSIMISHWLKQMGAEVIESRTEVTESLTHFSKWLKDSPSYWTNIALNKGWIDQREVNLYQYETNPIELIGLFKKLNLRQRAERINFFKPDLTISISFNASEEASLRSPGLYSPITKENACVAVVGGAYHLDEFKEPEHVVQLFFQLLSEDHDVSLLYADAILGDFSTKMMIRKLTDVSKHPYMRNNTVPTNYPGVYTRNLFITRSVYSPSLVIYPVFQNNIDEARLLKDKSITFETVNGLKIKTSMRLLEISQVLAEAIRDALLMKSP